MMQEDNQIYSNQKINNWNLVGTRSSHDHIRSSDPASSIL